MIARGLGAHRNKADARFRAPVSDRLQSKEQAPDMKIRGFHEEREEKLKGERLRCGIGLSASPVCIPPCFVPFDRCL